MTAYSVLITVLLISPWVLIGVIFGGRRGAYSEGPAAQKVVLSSEEINLDGSMGQT